MSARRPRARLAAAIVAAAPMLVPLAACAPEAGSSPTPDRSSSASASPSSSGSPTVSPSASPSTTPAALPTDCKAILAESVLAQLADVPLNDPGAGEATGVQPNGTLVCLWRDPRADTTFLRTEISRMNRGPALDLLNELAAGGQFTCYTPDGGTRCEGTWPNPTYPVTDGRTLFWRDDVLVDTSFSNLAPTGYTNSIVAHVFPSS
ncbi:hypothetical protein ACTU3I_13890 [Microbacterium sp. RD1]|uniref:hypothetical protein n=1 Tax=Microbacterium sp. RD1 TaxID=3457313 RepID=UPI003FA5AAF3